jgi:hypothetical protein
MDAGLVAFTMDDDRQPMFVYQGLQACARSLVMERTGVLARIQRICHVPTMLQAMPGSGKTSILQLFYMAINKQAYPTVIFVTLTPVQRDGGLDVETIKKLPVGSLVIVDEAHHAFKPKTVSDDSPLYQLFPNLVKLGQCLKIVAAATRRFSDNSASPAGFETMTFEDIKLTNDESQLLLSKLLTKVGLSSDLDTQFKNQIVTECGGHPAALVKTIDTLNQFASHCPKGVPLSAFLAEKFFSPAFTAHFTRLWGDSESGHILDPAMRNEVAEYFQSVTPTTLNEATECFLVQRNILSRKQNRRLLYDVFGHAKIDNSTLLE